MRRDRWAAALRLVGIGWYIAACIVLGLVLGLWLDSAVHTRPLFTMLGLFAGLGTAFIGLYRLISPMIKRNNKDKSKNRQ